MENAGNIKDNEESRDLVKYWQDLSVRTSDLREKMNRNHLKQQESIEVQKRVRIILKNN